MQLLFFYSISYNKNLKEIEISKYRLEFIEAKYNSVVDKYRLISSLIFQTHIEDNRETLNLISKFNRAASKEERNSIRERLYKRYSKLYQHLKIMNFNVFHFHTNKGDSLLRFHSPDKFGDSLIKPRYSLDLVRKKAIFVSGYEMGRVTSAMRYIYPLFYENSYIGSVEISLSIGAILSDMAKLFNQECRFIIKKDIVNKKHWRDKFKKLYIDSDISKNYLYERNIIDNSLSFSSSNRLTKDIVDRINRTNRDSIDAQLKEGRSFSLFSDIDGEFFASAYLPIYNLQSTVIGYIVSYSNQNDLKFSNRNFIIVQIIFGLLLIVALGFIYKIDQKNRVLLSQKSKLKDITKVLRDRNRELKIGKDNYEKFANAKIQFLSSISHELRTPLNSIVNFTDIVIEEFDEMLSDKSLQEEHRDYLQRVLKNSKNLLELINSVLEFTKIEFDSIEYSEKAQNISSILDNSLYISESMLSDKPVALQSSVDRDLIAKVDSKYLLQIMLNLISNSIKFTESGFIEVRAFRGSKGDIIIEVEDSGVGIEESKQKSIFEPFQKLGSFNRGFGLGLALVKKLCDDMDIDISFESKEGVGTTFRLKLKI